MIFKDIFTNSIQKTTQIHFTIKAYLGLGIFWSFIGFILLVLGDSLLFLPAFLPGFFDYGRLKPISSLILFFGAFLSLVLGLAYYILDKETKVKAPLAFFAFVSLKCHHIGLLFGTVMIFLGANKGREFGEMPWLADTLTVFAFLAFPIVSLITLGPSKKLFDTKSANPARLSLLFLILAFAGGFVSYLLGNLNLPSGWFASVPFFTGIQDAALQEVYWNGLLYFVIIGSLLGLLYYFIPLYYKTELYSSSIAFFVILSFLFFIPLSAGSGLVYTSAVSWLQSLGIFCTMALNFAVMAGGINAARSITRSSKKFHSDAVGLLLRTGIFFLLLNALGRALLAPRFMQAWSAYTGFDPNSLVTNLQTSGLLITLPLALVALQMLKNKAYAKGILRWLAFCWISGAVFLYLGNFSGGVAEYLNASALDIEGKELLHKDWESVFFSGSLLPKGKVLNQFLLSFRGLAFIGDGFFALSLIFFYIYKFYAAIKRKMKRTVASTAYVLPDLEYRKET